MPVPPVPPLDETIVAGQAGHMSDHEAIADALNNDTASITALNAAVAGVAHLAGVETFTGVKTFDADTLIDKGSQVFDVRGFASIQAALTAAAGEPVFLPPGTYDISASLDPGSRGKLIGAGCDVTTIRWTGAASGVMLYAPGLNGRLDGFTLDGDNIAGVVGIQADQTHRPNQAVWGHVRISRCLGVGFLCTQISTDGGIYYNDFGTIRALDCGVGVRLKTATGVGLVNANHFQMVHANNCTTGLELDGADGNTFDVVTAEQCTDGIKAIRAINVTIPGGWLEGNTRNINIANNPDVLAFWYGGNTDENYTGYTYTPSVNRSDLLAFKNGGNFYLLAGRWYFDVLEGAGASGQIRTGINGAAGGSAADPALTSAYDYGTGLFWVFGLPGKLGFSAAGVEKMRLDDNAVAQETSLMLWDTTIGALRRVSKGVAGSGGVGFSVLRITDV